jgi:hypothetical protein
MSKQRHGEMATLLQFHSRRTAMQIATDVDNSYRVEISGWDAAENFFVEKTVLDWPSDEIKQVLLRSRLREGSVIFMRLLQPLNDGHNFPLAYQAVQVTPKELCGQVCVRLAQLHPRATHRELALLEGNAAMQVA